MSSIVMGLGETGMPLFDVLREAYPDTCGYDIKRGWTSTPTRDGVAYLHICIPYSDDFEEQVREYQKTYEPILTIIHSTVPIGTTSRIGNAVHSPILGKHGNMEASLKRFPKWIGGRRKALELAAYFRGAGMSVEYVKTPETTEALKLMCLAKYGMSIAFAQYQKEVFDSYDIPYEHVLEWDQSYNDNVGDRLQRPLITPPGEQIGGHCVVQNTAVLNKQHPNQILDEILKYSPEEKSYKSWGVNNIYPTAKIGRDVSIGAFTEIGKDVIIGDRVRVGAMSFIPEGVEIAEDAWIGPRCTFTNDKYPPSGRSNWEKTIVGKGARLGAAVTVLCGCSIGEGALVGTGAVVTKDIGPYEVWAGVPAKKLRDLDDKAS